MGVVMTKETDRKEIIDQMQSAEELADRENQLNCETRRFEHEMEQERLREHFEQIKMMQKLSIMEAFKRDEEAEDLRRYANRVQFHYQMFKNEFDREEEALQATRIDISLGHPLKNIPDIGNLVQLLNVLSERLTTSFISFDGSYEFEVLRKVVSVIVEDLKTDFHKIESKIERYKENEKRNAESQLDQYDISKIQEHMEKLIKKLDERMSRFHMQRTTILDDVLSQQAQQLALARRRAHEHGPCREMIQSPGKDPKPLAIMSSDDSN